MHEIVLQTIRQTHLPTEFRSEQQAKIGGTRLISIFHFAQFTVRFMCRHDRYH